jgi:hypothetical protein
VANDINISGFKEARSRLKALDRRLVPEFNAELRKIAEPVRAEASRLAPRSGINRRGTRSVLRQVKRTSLVTRGTERNEHIADSLRIRASGSAVTIYSTKKSGAKTINYGGRHPLFGDRDHWYSQKPTRFMERAVARKGPEVTRQVDRFIADLLDRL